LERVRPRVNFPLLLQGTAPRSVLLERFKNTAARCCLRRRAFGRASTCRGSRLSCVIVDRLPFAVPSDPIVAARVRALEEDGRNAFAEFQVPQAVLALKQGFGRLIRLEDGPRVLGATGSLAFGGCPYGKLAFLESLPGLWDYRRAGYRTRSFWKRRTDFPGRAKWGVVRRRAGRVPKKRDCSSMFQLAWKKHFSSGHCFARISRKVRERAWTSLSRARDAGRAGAR